MNITIIMTKINNAALAIAKGRMYESERKTCYKLRLDWSLIFILKFIKIFYKFDLLKYSFL